MTALQPQRSDIMVAAFVAVGSLGLFAIRPLFDDAAAGQPWWSYAFPVLAGALLVPRRSRPVVTIVTIVAVMVVYLLLVDSPGPIGLPLLIGLYSVAAYGDRRTSIIAAVVAAISVSVAALTIAPDGPTTVGFAAAILLSIVPLLIGDAVRSRRALIAETDERVKLVRESAVREAQQQVLDERVRIARELHDVVAHSIATITVQAGVAAHVIDDQPAAAKDALVEIKNSSKVALGELRSMLGVLRDIDDDAERPLAPSPGIPEILSLIERYVGDITFDELGTRPGDVDPVVGLIAYRIVQESLTNVMKHAADAAVTVRLEYRPESLVVSVYNAEPTVRPGVTAASSSGGLGLVGLTERVGSVGGTIQTGPRFDGGFDVTADLPYRPAPQGGFDK